MDNNYQNPTDSQKRYWQFMYELAVHIYYLDLYLQYHQTLERRTNYFLAITASSSIASWVFWQKYSFIWALFIALSQVINSVKHLLPFAKREKTIQNLLPSLNKLFIACESEYYNISNGLMTDYDIHKITIKFKQEKNDINNKLNENLLPESERFMLKATEKAKTYLENNYKE